MDSRWRPRPISGIRQLEEQSFRVIRDEPGSVSPRTVIESRISTLVQEFNDSGLDQTDPNRLTYRWSFKAPLGVIRLSQNKSAKPTDTTLMVTGDLQIKESRRFQLIQESRLTHASSTQTLSTLMETAQGTCREQR